MFSLISAIKLQRPEMFVKVNEPNANEVPPLNPPNGFLDGKFASISISVLKC